MLRNKTLYRITSLCLLLVVNGVFVVDGDEVKSVSVMEGDSVTLHTDITQIQTDQQIVWMFGPQETRIAEIIKRANLSFIDDNDGRFKGTLKLDSQTGSLTITNISITHTGLYKLQILSNRGTSYKRFNVTVYAHLPVPVITRISNSSNCSTLSERSSISKCVLFCSVLNMRDVSLSWYKGNSLLSSISVSDLNNRLSLEVEYQDTNTYSCVVNNPITKQTQHLNINDVCEPCSDSSHPHKYLIPTAVLAVLALSLSVIFIFCKKHKRDQLKGNRFVPAETTEEEVHYADTTFCPQNQQKKRHSESETVYASVVT